MPVRHNNVRKQNEKPKYWAAFVSHSDELRELYWIPGELLPPNDRDLKWYKKWMTTSGF